MNSEYSDVRYVPKADITNSGLVASAPLIGRCISLVSVLLFVRELKFVSFIQ